MSNNNTPLEMPSDISSNQIPKIFLKNLEIKNFGIYDHIYFDFISNSTPNCYEPLICLIGPNGSGKTTILSAIQMLFNKFSSYDEKRYKALFSKYIRNYKRFTPEQLEKQDLTIKGSFSMTGNKDYDVCITRQNGVTSFHPEEISDFLPYCYFFARYDQELNIFQLKRNEWDRFKTLFESITGYEIAEDISLFDQSEDPRLNKLLKDYVLGFNVIKDNDIIGHKQCSAGEKKIIKTFSTVLNKPVQPNILLIDNALMHVESERHLNVIDSIKKCFCGSQIILTCHSEPVRRCFPNSEQLIDLRTLKLNNNDDICKLKYIDELREILDKINSYNGGIERNVLATKIIDLIQNTKNTSIDDISKQFLPLSQQAYCFIDKKMKSTYHSRISSTGQNNPS